MCNHLREWDIHYNDSDFSDMPLSYIDKDTDEFENDMDGHAIFST